MSFCDTMEPSGHLAESNVRNGEIEHREYFLRGEVLPSVATCSFQVRRESWYG